MSSLNPHYTFHYSQPEQYRFSHDSVFLSRRVFEAEGEWLNDKALLDICAGCGIVGLDLLFHARQIGIELKTAVFLEVQEIYREHFLKNSEAFAQAQFRLGNYESLLEPTETFDLIVCNPPYFTADSGKLSPSQFKNRCRFFIDSDLETLLKGIAQSLSGEGRAYVLFHDFEKRKDQIPTDLAYELLAPVRATPLVRLRRRA